MVQIATREFDTKRDNELIASGSHFFCQACLTAKPKEDQSPDPRYCQSCHGFLLQESLHLDRKPTWAPKAPNRAKDQRTIPNYGAPITPPPESHPNAAGDERGGQ